MKCPRCGFKDTNVRDSRQHNDTVVRRRECPKCHYTFRTQEQWERSQALVRKSKGELENYSREKLFRSIRLATKYLPLQDTDVDQMVNEIESRLFENKPEEIKSRVIGETVLDVLKEKDFIAYTRFRITFERPTSERELIRELQEIVDELKERLGNNRSTKAV